MTPSRILLVEDDSAIRESVAECLQAEGYAVHAVRNGAEALGWLRGGNRAALVVLDLVMPVMDGAAFLAATRSEPGLAAMPVVLMTAAMPSAANPLPPASAYLEKPFELSDLLGAVERLAR
jgi:CheY-like chemotaxis protein